VQRSTKLAFFVAILVGVFVIWDRLIDRMVFHPTPGTDLAPADVGLAGEDVFLETADGVRIHGFWLPAATATRAVLFLHGNAGNASDRLPNAAELVRLGTSVLLLDYRGYGRSEGRPSEAGVYADAQAGIEYLIAERAMAADRIVVFGRSLGGAVAIDLVQRQPVAGLILESTFTSLSDMAESLIPFAGSVTGGRYDSERKVADIQTPLLFFHGDRDEIVPFALGQRLFGAANAPKEFETIRGASHNDTTLVGGAAYFARIGRFLDAVTPPATD
jgi:fermentation-respiration switch protein FrsA (DUF1100 family)